MPADGALPARFCTTTEHLPQRSDAAPAEIAYDLLPPLTNSISLGRQALVKKDSSGL
jgi:hypothetical protein